MSYCIYLRKSRADTELERLGEGETLARHRRTLTELARKRGYDIGEVYEEIVSGETIAARPQMQRLLADVERGAWEGVLVMELERLARGNSIDQGIVAQAFKLTDTLIITPNKIFDPSNEFDEEYFEFGLFMSRREYKTINRRLQAGRIASVREGNYIASVAPFGYDKVRLEHGGYSLARNEQSQYVEMIFGWYVNEGLTVYKIADRLTQMGVTPKKGGDHFSAHSIRDILRNRVYTGRVTWNYRRQKKVISDGQVRITRTKAPDDQITVCEGKHEAIISDELFRAAQERTGHVPRIKSSKELKNPFAHVMKCKGCGGAVIYRPHNNSKSSDMLICPNKYCDVSGIPFEIAERTVLEQLEYELGRLKIAAKKHTIDITAGTQVKGYENELRKIKQQQNKLYDLLEQGIYTPEVFAERQRVLNEKRSETEKELSKLREKLQQPVNYEKTIANIEHLLTEYDNMSPTQINDVLRKCVSKIWYFREKSDRYHQNPITVDIEVLL